MYMIISYYLTGINYNPKITKDLALKELFGVVQPCEYYTITFPW